MTYFVRFTTNANLDIQRKQSIHATDFKEGDISVEDLAEMMNCDEDDIEIIEGYYVQMLQGLCGFELESDTLEDAIEEVNDALDCQRSKFHQYSDLGQVAIFKGKMTDSEVPDGDNFYPISIETVWNK